VLEAPSDGVTRDEVTAAYFGVDRV
jgi:hypothetical protein